MQRVKPGPGQESVWDYPRPPRLEQSLRAVRVVTPAGEVIAETMRAWRVMETSHPPSWYLPPEDVRREWLVASQARATHCEWKGEARYWSVRTPIGIYIENAAWSYAQPTKAFAAIRDHYSFYANALECFVDGERVQPQQGDFYGGWVTKDVVGPFKGGPGSWGW